MEVPMRQIPAPCGWSVGATAVAVILLAAMPVERTCAVDLLGLYAGAAIGQSHVQADASGFTAGDFKQNHSAFKVMAGVRPISPVGAELDYIDLGHPSGNISGQQADVTMKGEAAFGLLYLPVPIADVYAKLGLARLQSTVNSSYVVPGLGTCVGNAPNCAVRPFRLDRAEIRFAAGVGAQYKLGPWALRAEYERFDAAGRNPSLLSAGLTWTFF